MTISTEFKNAVEQKDLTSVRVLLQNSMILDPTFMEFDYLSKYAESRLSDLYEVHDGEIFTIDKNKWNEELIDLQMAKSLYNFSKERIGFLKRICAYIYADEIKKKNAENAMAEARDKRKNKKKIMMAGGAVAVAGVIAGSTVMTVAGVAIVGYGFLKV